MRFRYLMTGMILAAACSTPTEPDTAFVAQFDIEVSTEIFTVRVATMAQAEGLRARLRSGNRGVVTGRLLAGDGGFNSAWGWHLDPQTVEAPDLAIELCDGRPSMVEADKSYWFGSVKQFCPWGAKVVRER